MSQVHETLRQLSKQAERGQGNGDRRRAEQIFSYGTGGLHRKGGREGQCMSEGEVGACVCMPDPRKTGHPDLTYDLC